jgi:hypothetical protein
MAFAEPYETAWLASRIDAVALGTGGTADLARLFLELTLAI